jgi:hypothetical protein
MNLVGKELDKVSVKMEKNELASRAAGMFSPLAFVRVPQDNSQKKRMSNEC